MSPGQTVISFKSRKRTYVNQLKADDENVNILNTDRTQELTKLKKSINDNYTANGKSAHYLIEAWTPGTFGQPKC